MSGDADLLALKVVARRPLQILTPAELQAWLVSIPEPPPAGERPAPPVPARAAALT